MAKSDARFRAGLVAVATVVAGLTVLPGSPAAADVTSVSGSAFVATVRSTAGLVTLDPTPADVAGSATDPQEGYGPVERSAPALSVPDVLRVGDHRARTVGAGLAGENHLGSARSLTEADDVKVGVDGLTAAGVDSSCRSDGDGSVAETVLTDAWAGGNALPVRPEPNTQIVVPGVLTAVLNEQAVVNEVGVVTRVTVTALHVQLLPTATSPAIKDILIGQSTCRAAGFDVLAPGATTTTSTTTAPGGPVATIPPGGPGQPAIQTVPVVAAHSGKLLDVAAASTADGAAVIQWAGHGGDNQRWRLVPAADGAFTIVAVHSGKLLDVEAGSSADGARVIQWTAHGGPNQLWRTVPVGDGEFNIVAVHSGKLLDVSAASGADGAEIVQWPSHGGANQRWRLA